MTNSDHPYSPIYEKDGIVYVSGVATIDYETNLPIEGDETALDAALDQVESRLQGIGLDLTPVTKVT